MNVVYAGQLNRMVTVFKKVSSKNLSAEVTDTFEQIARIKAMRKDQNAGEVLEGKVVNDNTVVFTVRRQPVLLNSGELLYVEDVDGRFGVVGVQLVGQQSRFLQLKCYKQDFATPNA